MEGWYSMRCKLSWKLRATKSSRFYFQLVPSTHPTEETEYGLLPTPKAMDGIAENIGSGKELKLINGSFVNIRPKDGMRFGPSLNDIAKRGMLPTPTAFDWNSARTEEKWVEDKEKWAEKGVNLQMPLKQMAKFEMLPTPMSSDCWEKVTGLENQDSLVKRAREITGRTSQLSPQFVLEMMGFPTDWTLLPFLNGDKSPSKLEATQ
jgi:hypothetical protein